MRRYTPLAPTLLHSRISERNFKDDVNCFSSTSDFYIIHGRQEIPQVYQTYSEKYQKKIEEHRRGVMLREIGG